VQIKVAGVAIIDLGYAMAWRLGMDSEDG